MIASQCCKAIVWVHHGNEGTSFYVCSKCDRACDTLTPMDLSPYQEEINAEV